VLRWNNRRCSAVLLHWLASSAPPSCARLLAPLVIVALALPVVALVSLLLVALLVTPAVVRLVAERRFPGLHFCKPRARPGGGAARIAPWWHSPLWALACTVGGAGALVLSIPLWFVPPLVLVLPPLIWGWLTCRVLSFEVLALHATVAERRLVLRRRRWPLLWMGLVCGFLGTLPSAVWTLGPLALAFAPCWSWWRSGCTRWSSPFRHAGSRTLRWPTCSACVRTARAGIPVLPSATGATIP
jgi:hypothetical protein